MSPLDGILVLATFPFVGVAAGMLMSRAKVLQQLFLRVLCFLSNRVCQTQKGGSSSMTGGVQRTNFIAAVFSR